MLMKKIFTISLALALCSSINAEQVKILPFGPDGTFENSPNMMGLGMSPDGRYICGVLEMGAGIFVINTSTYDIKWEIVETDNGGELRHVDNTGLAVGVADQGMSFSITSGEINLFNPPAGFKGTICEDLTNNGDLIVGSVSGTAFITQAAYTLDKGATWTLLPEPTKADMGEFDCKSQGSATKYVSCDGKVIYGHMGSFAVPTLWLKNDAGEYVPDYFVARYVKTKTADIDDDSKPMVGTTAMRGMALSDNGRYVALTALYFLDDSKEEYFPGPAVYDTQEKKLIAYSQVQDIDDSAAGIFVTAISNDGTMVGTIGQPDLGSRGSFILRPGKTQAEKFVDAFPEYEKLLGEGDRYGFHLPTGISADGRYISGYGYYSSDYNDDSPAGYVTYFIDTQAEAGVQEIPSVDPNATVDAIYTLDGRRINEMTKGINIIRMSDGTVRKVLKK